MRSERVEDDPGGLVRRWDLDPSTACAVVALELEARCTLSPGGIRWPGLFVISGYRSRPVASALAPDQAPAAQSLHMARRDGRPASLAVDLRVGNLPASTTPLEIWSALGSLWKRLVPGGRWGGDFDPPDVNHFDMGSTHELLS